MIISVKPIKSVTECVLKYCNLAIVYLRYPITKLHNGSLSSRN